MLEVMDILKQLRSTQILDDCQRSLDLLEKVPDGDKQLFRIYWTYCLVELRSVEDALIKTDAKMYPEMTAPLKERHNQLMALKIKYPDNIKYEECDSDDYLIYHRLIRGERNSAVHEASQAYVDGMWSMVADKGLVNWVTLICRCGILTNGDSMIVEIGCKEG